MYHSNMLYFFISKSHLNCKKNICAILCRTQEKFRVFSSRNANGIPCFRLSFIINFRILFVNGKYIYCLKLRNDSSNTILSLFFNMSIRVINISIRIYNFVTILWIRVHVFTIFTVNKVDILQSFIFLFALNWWTLISWYCNVPML